MIRYVVGLGNPGDKYAGTPHNVGSQLTELLRESEGLAWKKGKIFDLAEGTPAYVRPNTYMNLSGRAVLELLRSTGCQAEEVLVCCDDFSLPLGTVRIRRKGSAGSHNGLKSVVETIGTSDFPRLRLGVGPVPPGEDPADFVLSRIPLRLFEPVREMLQRAAEAVQIAATDGIETAMNRFNS